MKDTIDKGRVNYQHLKKKGKEIDMLIPDIYI